MTLSWTATRMRLLQPSWIGAGMFVRSSAGMPPWRRGEPPAWSFWQAREIPSPFIGVRLSISSGCGGGLFQQPSGLREDEGGGPGKGRGRGAGLVCRGGPLRHSSCRRELGWWPWRRAWRPAAGWRRTPRENVLGWRRIAVINADAFSWQPLRRLTRIVPALCGMDG